MIGRDADPIETREWLDSLSTVTEASGSERAHYLLTRLGEAARDSGVYTQSQPFSAYRNTVSVAKQGLYRTA